jgi:RsiW-degrading membrane proteinase PrsW (M82 family)
MEEILIALQDFFACMMAGMTATGMLFFWLFIALFGLLWAFFIRIYIAYRMAKKRHRDPLGWVLLSFFFSPLLAWIVLLIAGEAK